MMLGYLNDGPAMIVIDTLGLGGYPTYGFFWGGGHRATILDNWSHVCCETPRIGSLNQGFL